jgi:hypothetical protein
MDHELVVYFWSFHMILISDTLSYRPDGTISGVTRIMRDTYTTPSGREMTEDISSVVALADVTAGLDASYAAFDAHNKALEQQIIDERVAAAADKAQALADAAATYAASLAAKDAIIAEKDAALAAAQAEPAGA